jgi:hypothetical protein
VEGQQTPLLLVSVHIVVVYNPMLLMFPTWVKAAFADKGANPFAFFFFKYS